jgi:hypothetical protein
VHEILRKEIVTHLRREAAIKRLAVTFVAVVLGFISLEVSVAAENSQKLPGAGIRAKFVGMQLTDEVHYRFVYEHDGTLRSYAMGVKKSGKWVVSNDQLCLYLQESDDGCYDVSQSGDSFTLTPAGLGLALTGNLQRISNRE